MPEQLRVAVVGGGIIGRSVAWRLARAGASVTVLDAGDDGAASTVAAGMLTPVTEAYWGEPALVALTVASLARWPSFAADLEVDSDLDVGLDLGGVLVVGVDRDDVAVIDDLHRLHRQAELPSERLGSRQLRSAEPLLAPGLAGGALAPGDGAVDPRRVLRALELAGGRHGVRSRAARVLEVLEADGHVTGVAVAPAGSDASDAVVGTGTVVEADAVVMAAGSWVGGIEGVPAPADAVRPVFGEVLRLRARDPALVPSRTIRAVVRGRHVYIVGRRDGEIVVGATSAERGHDHRVTAGGVYELLRDARAVVPALDDAELVEAAAGFRPGTPDNAPFIGPVGPAGLVLAAGHYRNGILLTPATAVSVADMVLGGPTGGSGPVADRELAAVVARACDPHRRAVQPPTPVDRPAASARPAVVRSTSGASR